MKPETEAQTKPEMIDKPKAKSCYLWDDVCYYIERKYNCALSSFHVGRDGIPLYSRWTRNFRIWMLHNCYKFGNIYWLSRTSSIGREAWVQEVIDMIFTEFPSHEEDIIYILL